MSSRRRSLSEPTLRLPARPRALAAPAPRAQLWRWVAASLGAGALFAAHEARGQVATPVTPSHVTRAARPTHKPTQGTTPAAAARAAVAPAKPDTAFGEVAPLPPEIAVTPAPPVPTAVADASVPGAAPGITAATPNIPGAPNFAGHLTTLVDRAGVVAPLVATVAGGSGAEVLHLQVLLDAARFSPGAVSGVWNENTVYAIRAFRGVQHLPPGDSADADVIGRLEAMVGPRAPITEYTITAADVRGPYRRVPGSIYGKAKLDCLCYQSMVEMLGERFHTTADALRALNPDVDVPRAPVGTRLTVPNVTRGAAPAVARLVVNKNESSMRGLDARGTTLFYLPVTVGSNSLPSPVGRLRVVNAQLNPRYQYDPVVLGEARGGRSNAILPAGPNSPVGVLWAQLSRPHVGLHGTPDPEDVGYTMSHGCVRMANWDARWLVPLLKPGLVVDFK